MNPAFIGILWEIIGPAVDNILGNRSGADTFKQKLRLELAKNDGKLVDFAREWLRADTHGAWYQRAWRPYLMVTCITIILLHLIIDPIVGFFFGYSLPPVNLASIPEQVWNIVMVSLGAGILGRSTEKSVRYWGDMQRDRSTPVRFDDTDQRQPPAYRPIVRPQDEIVSTDTRYGATVVQPLVNYPILDRHRGNPRNEPPGEILNYPPSVTWPEAYGRAVPDLAQYPIGIRQNNPLNIEQTKIGKSPWKGEVVSGNRFAQFTHPGWGLRAAAYLLKKKYFRVKKLTTIHQLIEEWAPSEDGNAVANYARHVARIAGVHPSETISLESDKLMIGIMKGMTGFENERLQPYTDELFAAAIKRI